MADQKFAHSLTIPSKSMMELSHSSIKPAVTPNLSAYKQSNDSWRVSQTNFARSDSFFRSTGNRNLSQRDLVGLEEEVQNVRLENSKLLQMIEESKMHPQLQEEYEEVQKRISDLQAVIAKVQNDNQHLEAIIDQENSKMQKIQRDCDWYSNASASLETENADLIQQIADITGKNDELRVLLQREEQSSSPVFDHSIQRPASPKFRYSLAVSPEPALQVPLASTPNPRNQRPAFTMSQLAQSPNPRPNQLSDSYKHKIQELLKSKPPQPQQASYQRAGRYSKGGFKRSQGK